MPEPVAPSRRDRAPVLVLAGLLLLGTGWALATPLLGAPDEAAHVVKAAAVGDGQIRGRIHLVLLTLTVEVTVPAAFADNALLPSCFVGRPDVTPACAPEWDDTGAGPARADTYVGFSPPLYYGLVAAPTRVATGEGTIYAMRLLSGSISAAFLAAALWVASRRGGFAVVGVTLALTPAVLYLAFTVNPNGLEAAAAVALWSSAAAVATADAPGVRRPLLVMVAVSFAVLANLRGLSIPYAVVALAAPFVLAGRRRTVARLGRTDVRWCLGACALSLVPAAAWVLTFGSRHRVVIDPQSVLGSVGETGRWLTEMLGGLGWRGDIGPPVPVWLVWLGLLAAFAVAAARRADRWPPLATAAAVGGAALVLPVAVEALTIAPIATNWQGRYALPLAAGVPVLVGFATRRPPGRVVAMAVPALAAGAHLAMFVVAARRYAVGEGGRLLYLRDPAWVPPVSPVLLLLVFAAGALVYAVALGALVSRWKWKEVIRKPTSR